MRYKKNRTLLLIISIAAVNLLGIILRIYKLDTYFILFGFRFQLSLTLPFFIIIGEAALSKAKEFLISPIYINALKTLLWIFLPFVILSAVLYFSKIITPGDPDYFYEFGLSSIFDLPLYLIWNLPQLLLFALYLFLIQEGIKRSITITAIIIVLLFAYEFVPLANGNIDYFSIITLFAAALSSGIVIKYLPNIYWFCVIIFMVFWLNLLAFGSDSGIMLHIIFAAEYDRWEGFFDIANGFSQYILPAQWVITLFFIYSGYLHNKNNI